MSNYLKQPKIRDKKYLESAKYLPCLVCYSKYNVVMHHIRYNNDCGTGIKPSDSDCLNLCYLCHDECHRFGENKFYQKYARVWGEDPIKFARKQYNKWLVDKGK